MVINMDMMTLFAAETALRRRYRIEHPSDLIRYLLVGAGYVLVRLLLKKFCPNMKPKTADTLAVIIVIAVAAFVIFISVFAGKKE